MKKRAIAMMMVATMVAGILAGCGNSSVAEKSDAANTEEGKVINIYSWNDEFRQRLEAVYPEVEKCEDINHSSM